MESKLREKSSFVFRDYKKALKVLTNSSKQYNEIPAQYRDIALSGIVKHFEMTFELTWKLLQILLVIDGISLASLRSVIKSAFKTKIIDKGELWLDMLDDRNRSLHIYDVEKMDDMEQSITNTYVGLFTHLEKKISESLP